MDQNDDAETPTLLSGSPPVRDPTRPDRGLASIQLYGLFKDRRTIQRMQDGPLGRFLALCAERLHAQGYARAAARRKLQLVAGFSRWLKRKRTAAAQLTSQHAKDYLH